MDNKIKARVSLVFVTIIWGVTFVLVKDALNDAPPFYFATMRFGVAAMLCLMLLRKKLFTCTKIEIVGGIICGIFLFLGYAFQNFGLMHTTASKSAFITSVSVLIVPILLVLFNIQKIHKKIWIAVVLATIGLYLLVLPSGGLNFGDILTFGCALSFAIHIIYQDYYIKKGLRIVSFLFTQSIFVTIISFFNAQIFEPQGIIWSNDVLIAIFITGVFATFIALLAMIWAQKILTPSETAIIFSAEPVAAALFATLFAGEILGMWGWFGGGLICVAVAYGESG